MNLPKAVHCDNCAKTVEYRADQVVRDGKSKVEIVCPDCHSVIAMFCDPPAKLFHVLITSGPHAYRYVGIAHNGGPLRNPDLQETPPVNLPDTSYGLWLQKGGAIEFSEDEVGSVELQLKELGYETEVSEAWT